MPSLRAACPSTLILFYLVTRRSVGEEQYRSYISLLCSLLQSPVSSSLPGSNIFFNTLSPILEYPQPMYLPQCEGQSLTKSKTSRKIKILYILKFIFLNSKLKTDDFTANNSKYSPSSICFYFLH